MILGLYFFFKGYVTAEIKGSLNEKIINKCIRNGIFMWNVKTEQNLLRINIRSCDREKLIDTLGEAEIVFTDKKGLPFIVERFKKRYALLFGVILFAAVTAYLSSLVWSIDINGCKITDPSDIMKILEENGVHKWSFKRGINEDKLKLLVMNSLDTISWIGIELKGTALKVEIKERIEIPYIVDNSAVDIVAAKDGVISKMYVRSGENLVAPGDTVIKGQVLVSALIERDGEYILEKPYTVHSYGDVIARTWYTYNISKPLYMTETKYTGNEYRRRTLSLFGFKINLFLKDSIPYKEYEKTVKRQGSFIALESTICRETNSTHIKVSIEDALNEAVSDAEKQLPEGILSSKCLTKNYTQSGDYINAEIVFECTENIAVEKPHVKRRETTNDSENNQIQ